MALIFVECDFRKATLDRLLRPLDEDTDASDDNLPAHVKGFLSMTRAPGTAIVDMLVNVDAICSQNTEPTQKRHHNQEKHDTHENKTKTTIIPSFTIYFYTKSQQSSFTIKPPQLQTQIFLQYLSKIYLRIIC